MEVDTVFQILQKKNLCCSEFQMIKTCSSLDQLLGGGVPLGFITQIAGESGVGKTQLCFQLCLNVQIPMLEGGIDGKAVFLDTENTFHSTRIHEMAEALISRIHKCSKQSTVCFSKMTVKKFLSGIYMFRCMDIVQLLAASHQMFEFIKQHPKVKLIIVDSVAHCIRHEEDSKARIKFLNTLAQNFRTLALRHNIAVVIVNQVTSRFTSYDKALTIPALGQTWSYVPSIKIMMVRHNDDRYALLYKSPLHPRGVMHFKVTNNGFCDSTEVQVTDSASFLTQNITNELLFNDFVPSDSCSKEQFKSMPEELSEKWLILSQSQLKPVNTENNENQYYENFDASFTDLNEKAESFENEALHAAESPSIFPNTEKTERNSQKSEDCEDRSQSPILLSRPNRKRKKLHC